MSPPVTSRRRQLEPNIQLAPLLESPSRVHSSPRRRPSPLQRVDLVQPLNDQPVPVSPTGPPSFSLDSYGSTVNAPGDMIEALDHLLLLEDWGGFTDPEAETQLVTRWDDILRQVHYRRRVPPSALLSPHPLPSDIRRDLSIGSSSSASRKAILKIAVQQFEMQLCLPPSQRWVDIPHIAALRRRRDYAAKYGGQKPDGYVEARFNQIFNHQFLSPQSIGLSKLPVWTQILEVKYLPWDVHRAFMLERHRKWSGRELDRGVVEQIQDIPVGDEPAFGE
jgi:hypothetical protein